MSFECVLSSTAKTKPTWFLDGQEIEINARYRVLDDGCVHRLEITDAVPSDSGEITAMFGTSSTTANLRVHGR